jgi:fructose-bisphosphate aldolase class II
MYTTPEEAVSFVARTGVDALAIAIGTAHGAYKTKPKLDIDRLTEIRKVLETPLVLHGGSGLSDDDFRNTIRCGIAKVNIFTDLCNAGNRAMKKGIDEGKAYLDIRNMKVEEIKNAVKEKISLFGSAGRE